MEKGRNCSRSDSYRLVLWCGCEWLPVKLVFPLYYESLEFSDGLSSKRSFGINVQGCIIHSDSANCLEMHRAAFHTADGQ